jgi:hypothetical protein
MNINFYSYLSYLEHKYQSIAGRISLLAIFILQLYVGSTSLKTEIKVILAT